VITAQKIKDTKPVALVAGGAGFIGSFLCEALLLQGCRVIALDDLSSGKKENLKKCFEDPDFTFLEHDLTLPFPKLLDTEEISYIFNLVNLEVVEKKLWQLAEKKGAKLLLVASTDIPTSAEIFRKEFPKVDFRVCYLGNVYGPRMKVEDVKLLEEKIFSSSCVFVTDVIFGIIKAMFTSGTRGESFSLTFKGEEKLKWQPRVTSGEGLEQTLKFFESPKPVERKNIPRKFCRKSLKKLIFAFSVFLFFLLAPFLLLFLEIFLGVENLKKAQDRFLKADFQEAIIGARRGEKFFEKAKVNSLRFRVAFLSEPLLVGKELARGIGEASLAAKNIGLLTNFIFQNQPGDIENLLSEAKVGLDQAYYYFSLIDGKLKNRSLINQIPQILGLKDQFNKLNREILQVKEVIIQARRGVEILPHFIGRNQKRTYLVLFQNSSELRPTGGFIGSFAFLTFEKGKFLDFEVQDVYWADGQLKGHVEPPAELKKYLGEANWYLRDANWDPDFPTSAVKIQWFLEKETGRVVDGVLGINLLVAQRLLEAVGEIEIPDYKEKINDSNIFERAQYYSEIGFFPGSTQKQDFLGSLGRALFEKIKNAEGEVQIEIAQAIYQSLKTKDILVYLNEPSLMEVISELGWDGGIRNVKCQMSNVKCIEDYLFVVEANVGVNKANYFVERSLNEEIKIEADGQIRKILKISYQNKSPSAHFPAGDYKNYLRVLVPQGSQLEKVFDGSKEVEKERIDVSNISEKASFGFLVNVPVGEKKEVEISWILAEKIEFDSKVQYLYLVQKQSGTKEEKFNLKISPPSGIAIIPVWPAAKVEGASYIFTSEFLSDLLFEIYFVR